MTDGIIFDKARDEVDLRLTRRADLAADRMARGDAGALAVIETPNRDTAKKLRRVLERVFVSAGTGGLMTVAQASDALTRCRRLGFTVHTAESLRRRKPILASHMTPLIERRYVPDPSMSRAEQLEQTERYPNSRWIGWVKADVDLRTLVGGLARVKRRTHLQTEAAARFRLLSERAQLGGGKAIDYSAVKVDTSPAPGNPTAAIGEDARAELRRVRKRLGDLKTVAERVIIDDYSISDLTRSMGLGTGRTAREKTTDLVLAATDILAIELGLVRKPRVAAGQ